MIFRSGRFRKPLAMITVFSFVAICRGEPDAEAILRAARLNPVGQKISLEAQLRTGSTNTPFEIIVDEATATASKIQTRRLILELREDSSSLSERVGGKTAPVKPARYDDPVRGTGITYEDLFLRFLYWKRPKLLGEDTIRSRKAWKIELQAWGTSSQYGVARLGSIKRAVLSFGSRATIERESFFVDSKSSLPRRSTVSGCSSRCAWKHLILSPARSVIAPTSKSSASLR